MRVENVNGIWVRKFVEKDEVADKHAEFYEVIKEVTGKQFIAEDYRPYSYHKLAHDYSVCICSQEIKNILCIESRDEKHRFQVGCVCIKKITKKYDEEIKHLKSKFEGRVCSICDETMRKVRNQDKYECKYCRLPFGKHKGKSIQYVPLNYLRWIIRESVQVPQPLYESISRFLDSKA